MWNYPKPLDDAPLWVVVLFVIACVVALYVSSMTPAPAGQRFLPNHKLTPGDINASADVCKPGSATAERNVSVVTQKAALAAYKMKTCGGGTCVFDHLVPLELGGSNALSNIWPQRYVGPWNSLMKDALEDRLHAYVCNGKMSLAEAQKAVTGDWRVAYKKLFPTGAKAVLSNDAGAPQ